jgi:sulfofructose kinase
MESGTGMDVVCIGLAGYDLIFPLPEFPQEDKKYQTGLLYASGGGPAANAAYLLSSWGLHCGLACVLGDDEWGKRVRGEFTAARTDLSLSEIRRGAATPLSCIWVNQNSGSRTIVNYRQAGDPLRLEPSRLKSFEPKPGWLLMDGHEPAASLKAMAAWPQAVSVLDAGSRRRGTEILAARVNYLVASASFACALTGVSGLERPGEQEECLRRLMALNGKQVVVTLGRNGLIYLDRDRGRSRLRHLPAMPALPKAVDTTAAGDIFHGAFTYCLVRGKPLPQALRIAAAAASLSVTRPGGRASIPERGEVKALLQQGESPC